MSESESHKRAKRKAAGPGGEIEVKQPGNKRLDALTKGHKRATEVERSGNIDKAVQRLKKAGTPQKVLQVPQKDMEKAVDAMKKAGVSGTVKNMGGTKRTSVPKKKK